jgi:hypothetical protein
MARHALTEPATGLGPAEVAGLLCGAHAPVLSAAELLRPGRGNRTRSNRAGDLMGQRRCAAGFQNLCAIPRGLPVPVRGSGSAAALTGVAFTWSL